MTRVIRDRSPVKALLVEHKEWRDASNVWLNAASVREVALVRVVRTAVSATVLTVAIAGLAVPAAATGPRKAWGRPCSVVKVSDVEQITGATVARTKTNSGPVAACLYYDGSSPEAIVGIWLNAKPLTGTAADQYSFDAKQAKSNSINHKVQAVQGLGTKAFYFESEIFNRIEVLVGKRLFHVDGPELTLDQAQNLARKVLAKS
jgi:hypothetical protein